MTKPFALAGLALALSLSGCVASTAASIVTAPVRVAGKAVDLATTSQSEADEKRGRQIRQREEKLGKLDRAYQKHLRECDRGNSESCLKARNDYAQMQMIMPSVPYEPR